MELNEIHGLGPVRLEALRAVGIASLRDLLNYLPVSYEDLTKAMPCAGDETGMMVVQGQVQGKPQASWHQGLSKVEITIADASGKLHVVWFNQPWMSKQLKTGQSLTLYGRVAFRKNGLREMQNPQQVHLGEIRPVYKPIAGIPPKTLRDLIHDHLDLLPEAVEEVLPEEVLKRYHYPTRLEAIQEAHAPTSLDAVKAARQRLAFEEMLMYLFAVHMQHDHKDAGFPMQFPDDIESDFWNRLSFAPTGAQSRVLHEVISDMRKPCAMSRLVQGDVGCGKTALAFGAIFAACHAGFQVAMMAPTEILARQHFQEAQKVLGEHGISCGLLVGSLKASEKRKAHAAVEDGTWQAVFGTHALIQEAVHFKHLGLVITDEQHRFGVRQRSFLQEKGDAQGQKPHVLVMSATPIPRTLALILYGDLDLSVVDELPSGRKPVKTRLVPDGKRDAMYTFLRDEVSKGHQAYVVCPLVEDSEMLEDVKSAQATYEALKDGALQGLKVALTWGDQKAEEKQEVLRAFAAGETDVLVSTTVIEVGVNVPNATIMIVENAERFGLSQLHQLRGRVGRGSEESWCFLMAGKSDKLKIMTQTNDGFLVAQKDLEIRGPGELMGTRQSGQESLGFLLDGDVRLLEQAKDCVTFICDDENQKENLASCRKTLEKIVQEKYAEKVGQIARN